MTAQKPANLVPRLRFPEFQNASEWKRGRCRDIAKVLPGYGFPEKFQGNKEGQYPFYKVSDISRAIEMGQRYISEANNYIDSDVLDKIRGKSVPSGTIIFAKIGEAIRSNRRAITTKPAVIDNNTAGAKAMREKISDEFLFYLWSNVSLIDHAGGAVPAVSKSALESVPLCYPNDPAEQQRIADCLGSLDDLIAAEGRKLEALRQHKQGLMQQLFPQPGETVPQLRFPEFREADEWEEKKIGDLSEVKASGDLDVAYFSNFQSMTHLYPVYSNAVENAGLYGYYSLPQYKKNSVTITARGTLGVAFLRNHEFMGIGRLIVVSDLRNLDPCFLKECWNHLAVIPREVTSIPQLTAIAVRATVLPIPRPAEQRRIATCLSSLEDVLAAQARKLDTLKQHKQGLLQQLFPNPETK